MLDHMILAVSDVKRSLAFYEAALKPFQIKFFLPYAGEAGHPDLWGFGDGKRRSSGSSTGSLIQQPFTGASWPKMKRRSMNSTRPPCLLAPRTTSRHAHGWNTIRVTTPLMYSTQTDIHSKSSIRANSA